VEAEVAKRLLESAELGIRVNDRRETDVHRAADVVVCSESTGADQRRLDAEISGDPSDTLSERQVTESVHGSPAAEDADLGGQASEPRRCAAVAFSPSLRGRPRLARRTQPHTCSILPNKSRPGTFARCRPARLQAGLATPSYTFSDARLLDARERERAHARVRQRDHRLGHRADMAVILYESPEKQRWLLGSST